MLERFSDRARKAVTQSQNEARKFNHEAVGTEHLLLALLSGDGVACNVLRNFDIDYCIVRKEIGKIVQMGPPYVIDDEIIRLPHTPRLKHVFTLAEDEAQRLGHNYVGTEHLLLALFRETEGVAHTILKKNLDLDFGILVKEIDVLLDQSNPEQKSKDKYERIVEKLKPLLVQQSNLIQKMLVIITEEK